MLPLDLHVLSLSLAFILSQDQTLRCNYIFFSFFPFFSGHLRSTKASWRLDFLKPALYLLYYYIILSLSQRSSFLFSLFRLRHSRVTSLSKAGAKVLQVFIPSKFFRNFFWKNFKAFRNSLSLTDFVAPSVPRLSRRPLQTTVLCVFDRKGCKNTAFLPLPPNFLTPFFIIFYQNF